MAATARPALANSSGQPKKAGRRQVEQAVFQLHHQAASLLVGVEIAAHELQRGAERLGLALDHFERPVELARDHHRPSPALIMPAFSQAILESSGPSISRWS